MPSSADRALPAARRLRNLEAERLARRQRFLDQFHALDLLELALRLRRLGGNGAEAVAELPQRGDFLLLVFVGGELLFVVRLALLEEVGVVARVGDQLAARRFRSTLSTISSMNCRSCEIISTAPE